MLSYFNMILFLWASFVGIVTHNTCGLHSCAHHVTSNLSKVNQCCCCSFHASTRTAHVYQTVCSTGLTSVVSWLKGKCVSFQGCRKRVLKKSNLAGFLLFFGEGRGVWVYGFLQVKQVSIKGPIWWVLDLYGFSVIRYFKNLAGKNYWLIHVSFCLLPIA